MRQLLVRDTASAEKSLSSCTGTLFVCAVALLIGIVATPKAAAQANVSLTVDAASVNSHPISPYIYGLNFAKETFASEIGLPVRRWGGNTTTRYNWPINAMNHGSDWFFHNNTNYNPYTNTNENSDQWIGQNKRTGTESLITMPMIGYVTKNGNQSTCGFSVAKYGAQDATDADAGFPDCGNGFKPNPNPNNPKVPITNNDPKDTSDPVTDAYATSWVNHHTVTFGTAMNGGVKFYALDNEPGLWQDTHRDVHPLRFTYDESYSRGSVYAAAIKSADPSAMVLGPVQDGWTRYYYASYVSPPGQTDPQADADRNNHGGMDFVPWYLQQMKNYETNNGVRLLDYLDLHFYPQNGVDLTTAGDANQQALRLRSTRALWDPTYVDESWIKDAGPDQGIVRLIPRMHAWVDANYPGTKLALSEYNWGGLEHINGALAQADVLGIFGREGLDMATLWNYPFPPNPVTLAPDPRRYDIFETLPGAYAFRIYRNYDGLGGKFGDLSVPATSSDQGRLAIYAAWSDQALGYTLVVINKTGGVLTANVALSGMNPKPLAKVYVYSDADLKNIVPGADKTVTPAGFSASFPANSITLFVIKNYI